MRERLPARPRRRAPRAVLVLTLLALAGALAAAPPTRGALLDLLDLVPGVRIQQGGELPPTAFREPPDYGVPADLGLARGRVAIPLVLPDALGEPSALYVDDERDAVTTVYGDPGRPRAVFTQFPARAVLFEKMLGYDSRVERVDVEGAPGLWIEGANHDVFYDGDRRVGGYLAGNVLVWHRGGITYRLEADVSRARALELARSL